MGSSGWGNTIAAFIEKFELGANNSAEMQAIISGIQMCKDLDYYNIRIESDSELVMRWITHKRCTILYLWEFWDTLEKELEGLHFYTWHQFGEGKQVEDFFTRIGEGEMSRRFFVGEQMPRKMRGLMQVDKSGMPCFEAMIGLAR